MEISSLFIDEIHTLVGAGKGEGAWMRNMKPALARGEARRWCFILFKIFLIF